MVTLLTILMVLNIFVALFRIVMKLTKFWRRRGEGRKEQGTKGSIKTDNINADTKGGRDLAKGSGGQESGEILDRKGSMGLDFGEELKSGFTKNEARIPLKGSERIVVNHSQVNIKFRFDPE